MNNEANMKTAREVVDAIYAEWDASGACGPPIMRKHIAAVIASERSQVEVLRKNLRSVRARLAEYEPDITGYEYE